MVLLEFNRISIYGIPYTDTYIYIYIYMPRPSSAHPGNIDILVSFMPAYPAVTFSCCKQGGHHTFEQVPGVLGPVEPPVLNKESRMLLY